jgi:hypothetical protein
MITNMMIMTPRDTPADHLTESGSGADSVTGWVTVAGVLRITVWLLAARRGAWATRPR